MNAPAPAPPRRSRPPLPDLAALLALLVAGAWTWLQGRAPMPAGADVPPWAGPADRLLYGPDAGAWAANAWAMHLGNWQDLDPHRMPTWPALTAGMLWLQPDVALAGHLVNHLLALALPLVVYAVARATCGRGPVAVGSAFGAALVVALLSPLVQASHSSCADPLVALAQPLALLAGLAAARWPLASPLFGVAVTAATGAHLTTLGVAGPALLLALCAGRPGWARWGGALGLALGALGTGWLALALVPVLEPQMFVTVLAEGITRANDTGHHSGGMADTGAALQRLREGAPRALDDAMRVLLAGLRAPGFPWHAALALPWLAALAAHLPLPGEPVRAAPGRWAAVGRGVWRVLAGVALLGGLLPLVAFAAAGSPERYATNFLPVGAIVFARGIASAGAWLQQGAEALARRYAPGRSLQVAPALGVLLAAGGVAWTVDLQDPQAPLVARPPPPQIVDARAIGDVLAANFTPGGGVGCRLREAGGHVGRSYCPAVPCPGPATGWDVSRCLETALRPQCSGEGAIPWVVIDSRLGDERTDAQKALDTWIDSHFTPLATVQGQTLTARVYALPRTGDGTAP